MSNRMWGGRFSAGPSAIMEEINASIDFDRKLYAQDIAGSKAHAEMLAARGIISADDAGKIAEGLDAIKAEIDGGNFTFSRALEDIHMNIEARLKDLIGAAAGRLHTARSRNDQVATDFRLWVRDTLDHVDDQLADLMRALVKRAGEHADTVMPGFTHLQSAQPVTFGHHLMAYVEMLARDRGRVQDARRRLNECPLGAAALAGTSFPIDRHMTAANLGFDRPTANSLDSVSDRDFALEAMSAASITTTAARTLSSASAPSTCTDAIADSGTGPEIFTTASSRSGRSFTSATSTATTARRGGRRGVSPGLVVDASSASSASASVSPGSDASPARSRNDARAASRMAASASSSSSPER